MPRVLLLDGDGQLFRRVSTWTAWHGATAQVQCGSALAAFTARVETCLPRSASCRRAVSFGVLPHLNLAKMHAFLSAPPAWRGNRTREARPLRPPSRHYRCRTSPHTPRAVLHKSHSGTDATKHDPDPTQLKTEHLGAYFDAHDSTYQVQLRHPFVLALHNFVVELGELHTAVRRVVGLDPPLKYTPPDCLNLRLSAEAIANREREREDHHLVPASPFVRFVYRTTCALLDYRFEGRPIPRFWVLETVARMPYFAYSSCLHLLATLGWFRSPTLMNMHHAEELNEAYHLAVMEALGGDKRWSDRFLAFHASILYYWFLVILFFISPTQSYRFSELIEAHAVDTYDEFLESNEEMLHELPVPDVAYEYYDQFLYYFYEFQLAANKPREEGGRRPQLNSLYDVFSNILLDEREHTRTMSACTNYIEKGETIQFNGKSVSGTSRRQKTIPERERQHFWKKWAELHEKEKEEG